MNWTREELKSVDYVRLYDESVIKMTSIADVRPLHDNTWAVYFVNEDGSREVLNSENVIELITKEEFPEYYL